MCQPTRRAFDAGPMVLDARVVCALNEEQTTAEAPGQRAPGRRQPRGFTLIELMVVLAVVAGLTALAGMGISSLSNSNLHAETLRLSGALRLVYGRAAINGLRYQVVFDLDAESFRVECSNENFAVVADTDEAREQAEEAERRAQERRSRFDDEEADPFGLGDSSPQIDDCSEELIPNTTLRHGIKVARIVTSHHDEPVDSGSATVGFFPNGTTERTMIWLSDANERAFMTMTIDPMTGRVIVRGGDVEIPDDFFDVEED